MSKKLCVNSMCIACNICTNEAPKTFELKADPVTDMVSSVVVNQNGNKPEEIQRAIDMCPVTAISWEEEEENK